MEQPVEATAVTPHRHTQRALRILVGLSREECGRDEPDAQGMPHFSEETESGHMASIGLVLSPEDSPKATALALPSSPLRLLSQRQLLAMS